MPTSALVSNVFNKPLAPKFPVSGTIVLAFAAPASKASLHPSPSESKSKRLGIPSLSESTSLQVNPVALFAINLKSVNNLVVAPGQVNTKL